MAVVGYNVDPESTGACIGVEMEQSGTQAVIYINQEKVTLSRDELSAFIVRCTQTLSELEWAQAQWVYLHDPLSTDKYHLMRKENRDQYGKALCGARPPTWGMLGDERRAWSWSPVIGEPWNPTGICKKCYRAWQKAVAESDQRPKETAQP